MRAGDEKPLYYKSWPSLLSLWYRLPTSLRRIESFGSQSIYINFLILHTKEWPSLVSRFFPACQCCRFSGQHWKAAGRNLGTRLGMAYELNNHDVVKENTSPQLLQGAITGSIFGCWRACPSWVSDRVDGHGRTHTRTGRELVMPLCCGCGGMARTQCSDHRLSGYVRSSGGQKIFENGSLCVLAPPFRKTPSPVGVVSNPLVTLPPPPPSKLKFLDPCLNY